MTLTTTLSWNILICQSLIVGSTALLLYCRQYTSPSTSGRLGGQQRTIFHAGCGVGVGPRSSRRLCFYAMYSIQSTMYTLCTGIAPSHRQTPFPHTDYNIQPIVPLESSRNHYRMKLWPIQPPSYFQLWLL